MIDETFDYVEYLDRKKDIDDRSLNQEVWNEFAAWLADKSAESGEVRILEIGAGIGTMIERLLEKGLLCRCRYFALEPEADFRQAAFRRLKIWAEKNAVQFEEMNQDLCRLSSDGFELELNWLQANAEQIPDLFTDASLDLLVSHAVIDLLPVPRLLPAILQSLKPGGAFYFSLNFSGDTIFYPSEDDDKTIAGNYHADMDNRFSGLDWKPSLTGARLPAFLLGQGFEILAEGESDWELGAKDHAFIRNILDTVNKALSGQKNLDQWYDRRLAQLENEELVIKISNRDCFGLK